MTADGFVADSSVAIAWVAPSQSNEEAARLLEDVATGTPFVVPVLWMFEVANCLLVLTRRRLIDSELYARARRDLSDLSPVVDEEGYRLTLGKVSELAQLHSLSIYDATYLELALRRGLPLASRDKALNKAARTLRVKTLL